MTLVKIAWRNLWRNPRRSIIITSALIFGLTVLIFFMGFSDGSHEMMIFNGTRSLIGHIQIHAPGYLDDPAMDKRIEVTHRIDDILSTYPHEVFYAPRIYSQGLIAKNVVQDDENLEETALKPEGFILLGVDPKQEPLVTDIKDSLIEGNWLGEDHTLWFMGLNFTRLFGMTLKDLGYEGTVYRNPMAGRQQGSAGLTNPGNTEEDKAAPDFPSIIIGVDLAKVLNVRVGDEVALITVNANRFLSDRIFRVGGLFKAKQMDMNRSMAFMDIETAREYLEMDKGVMEIVFWLGDSRYIDDLTATLRSEFYPPIMTLIKEGLRGKDARPVEALPWQEVSPELDIFIKIDDASLYIVAFIVFIVVALSILNTISMSTMERTFEFGVLLAIGTKPSWIVRLVLMETALLVLLSVAIGIPVGLITTYYFQIYGINFGLDTSMLGLAFDATIYAKIVPVSVVQATLMAAIMGLLSGIYPSIQAARLDPIKAIHQV